MQAMYSLAEHPFLISLMLFSGMVLLAGIFQLFLGILTKRKASVLFAVMAFADTVYTIANVHLYQCSSIDHYFFWLRIRMTAAVIFFITITWFLHYWLERKKSILPLFFMSSLCVIVYCIRLSHPYTYLADSDLHFHHATLPWGESLQILEFNPHPFYTLHVIMAFATSILCLFILFQCLNSHKRFIARKMIILVLLMIFCMIYDLSTIRLGLPRLQIGEVSIIGIILLSGWELAVDVSKTILAEERNQEHARMQSQKMSALFSLAQNISHEMNNYIGTIRNSIGMLELEFSRNPETRSSIFHEGFQSISSGLMQATHLTSQLKSLSSPLHPQFTEVSPQIFLQEMGSFCQASFPECIQVCVECKPHTPLFIADPILLHQAVLNLCMNAMHAMTDMRPPLSPSGGTLTLRCFVHENQLCLQVRDTGVGISEEDLGRIWEPFFTTREIQKGTGLGLFLAFSIVQSLHGEITVQSQMGHGSEFTIQLPSA